MLHKHEIYIDNGVKKRVQGKGSQPRLNGVDSWGVNGGFCGVQQRNIMMQPNTGNCTIQLYQISAPVDVNTVTF